MEKVIAISILLLLTTATLVKGEGHRKETSALSNHSIALRPVSPAAVLVFENIIRPWIQTEFAKNISDDLVYIRRGLLFSELYRYEIIEGQHRYSVHIEFAVRMREKATGMEKATVRGQEIIFWVEEKEVKDFFPFGEYVITEGARQDDI